MMNKFSRWEPEPLIPNSFSVERILDDNSGLRVLLLAQDDTNEAIELLFTDHLGYQCYGEGDRLRTLRNHPELQIVWSLFIGQNTYLIDWLVDESSGVLSASELFHFIITTHNEIFEIITYTEPVIRRNLEGTSDLNTTNGSVSAI